MKKHKFLLFDVHDYGQRTPPEQTRSILASQPQIAYALIALMVKINAVDVQVLQVGSALVVIFFS